MKRYLAIAGVVILGGISLWALRKQAGDNQDLPKRPLYQLEPWPSAGSPKAIPESMRSITEDPAVVELIPFLSKNQIGKVTQADSGMQQLVDGADVIFEARGIGGRSRARDGTMAVEAVTGDLPSIETAEITGEGLDAKLVSSPREIWVTTKGGGMKKVSPSSVDAFAPVISPNGNIVAFTGRAISERGTPSGQSLYITDMENSKTRVFTDDNHLHNFQIWALDWVEDGKTVRILQDHGETGGHMKLLRIRVAD